MYDGRDGNWPIVATHVLWAAGEAGREWWLDQTFGQFSETMESPAELIEWCNLQHRCLEEYELTYQHVYELRFGSRPMSGINVLQLAGPLLHRDATVVQKFRPPESLEIRRVPRQSFVELSGDREHPLRYLVLRAWRAMRNVPGAKRPPEPIATDTCAMARVDLDQVIAWCDEQEASGVQPADGAKDERFEQTALGQLVTTAANAAKIANVSSKTMNTWIREHNVQAENVGGKKYRFNLAELEAHGRAQGEKPSKAKAKE